MNYLFFLLIPGLFTFSQASAQQVQIPQSTESSSFSIGKTDKIKSNILGESRTLNIYLPEGYHPDSAKTYPVIYLLDGSANEDFIHVAGLVQFLTMTETMPATIVVGIGNIDRKRDFTFPTTNAKDKKDYPTTGQSEKFIRFIGKELQPYIAKNYKTNGIKTLSGQSLGALLATEVLLKAPSLFNQYLIVSPSLWWDDESLLAKAPELLKTLPAQKIKVYVAVGKEGAVMEGDAKKLSEILKTTNLEVHFAFFPEGNHANVLHHALYKGFELFNPKK
ncbi:alpha/beta hydrolase-fold protein [Pedobacter sp. PLR]|uniref:alpha/beta hydrolase n=1 Tax=Pedobacter sp. PLR TaxID=2994465 RepID=UPI00224516FA|nr:alpha/beta hydrolase-fold protein [Pedobacter sp. PLR]MCX2452187.1 alpha/beta hydrolase-fold protein [Pedobacter sp. PLR]